MRFLTHIAGKYTLVFLIVFLIFLTNLKSLKNFRVGISEHSGQETKNVHQNVTFTPAQNGFLKEESDKREEKQDIVIFGNLKKNTKYAVFSTTSDGLTALNFIFYLPLTSLAWKRIGFESVIVIVGSYEKWKKNKLLSYVLETLQKFEVVIIFIETEPKSTVMISQVSRLFAANILLTKFPDFKDTYLITSDTDLWPIAKETYSLPPGKQILSLNSDCCAPFKHKNKIYKMLPLANIGMRLSLWNSLMTKFNLTPATSRDIQLYMINEFGDAASRPVTKGENTGWYMDQLTVSIAIENLRLKNASIIKYSPRSVGHDRIDKNHFKNNFSIEDKTDSHLPNDVLKKIVFLRVLKLLKLMFTNNPKVFDFMNYYETFIKLMQSR